MNSPLTTEPSRERGTGGRGTKLAPGDPRKPGTIRMAARLEALALQSDPRANRFLNRERAATLRSMIAANPEITNSAQTIFRYGIELLDSGQNVAALDAFRRVAALSREHRTWEGRNEINVTLDEALCYLRMGEQRNCLSNHNADSCILPIQGGGIYQWKDGSLSAANILTNLLTRYPTNLAARWLLNVAAMTAGTYPQGVPPPWLIPPETFRSDYDIKRFVDVAGQAGLAANELAGASAVDDFDGDGLLDVIVTSWGMRDQMHFFHNNGDGTFSDRTADAGLAGLVGGLNIVTADYNNDGFVDLLVLRGAWMGEEGRVPNSLLRNNGDGTFEDVTEEAHVLSFHPTQTAVWFDFDGDGWLDLFIGNETTGVPSHPCELYHNNRDGTFTEMAASAGLDFQAFVKGVTSADYNNDGRPDLYVSILGRPNLLFRNDGPRDAGGDVSKGWKFSERAAEAGVQQPVASFPTWFFDFDNDGWEDIFVAGYHIGNVGDIAADYLGLPGNGERAKLYRNRGDGTFADVTAEMHLDHVLHAMGCNFGDLDNDGWLDFYLGTGDPDYLTLIPNRMFRNAEGRFFQDVTTSGGFGNIQKGHGVSFADIDNDGDQDIHEDMGGAVSGDNYPNVLYLNPGHGNHWLKLQLVGVKANRSGIGARIAVTVNRLGGQRVIHRTVGSGGSFGCNPLRQEIGLGDAREIALVEIRWPGSATVQRLTSLEMDRCYRIREDAKAAEAVALKTFAFPPMTGAMPMHHHHGM